ncbi:hypothetical protein LO762_15570 [Actinocorallia sp. API 0066]|uniref:hypothetical protein n=1 Tax=Actinocorallia sp. API 0066 TaxID=2896846 RepID=UPI001E620A96|nr:hypothetical protein [Actinocorallia sp. API 0066]MCD0450599.1 hypothetical protein [Actinocorallia sp. API 0066]
MHGSRPSPSLVAWANAWLTGHTGLDLAVDAVERTGPHLVGEVPLRAWLAGLRPGLRALRLALPAPGDPLGLTGPPEFNAAALETGEAAVALLEDTAVGLVPAEDRRGSSYTGTVWRVFPARLDAPDVPSVAEADRALTAAMHEVTEIMTTLDDINGERSAVLKALRDDTDSGLAPGYPARAHRVDAQAVRLGLIVGLAGRTAGGNLTAAQAAARAEALRLLDRAVRRAHVAAHGAVFEPAR